MSRAERLLELLQNLRRRKLAVNGRTLAEELGINLRTLYRDIAALKAQGAPIAGAAGAGFLLRPGYTVPPLMFTREELEAMMLGARWVVDRGDERLGLPARDALAKIGAVLPPALRDELSSNTLLIPSQERVPVAGALLSTVRQAIRHNQKLAVTYRDLQGRVSERTLWPFALIFFDQVRVVAAWCEEREAFRHFRADRIEAWTAPGTAYPARHQDLLRRWREAEGIPSRVFEL